MFTNLLALPLPAILAIVTAFFSSVAILLVLLSFVFKTSPAVRSYKGVVAPFVGTVAVMFGIILGFLASDVWDRERRAAAAVRSEADSLLSLTALATTFGLPREPLTSAIHAYAETAIKDEWPSMYHGDSAPATEAALDQLLKTIARLDLKNVAGEADLHRILFDTGLAVRNARSDRLRLSRDGSNELKWLLVFTLAVLAQTTVATVHLEQIRPQIAALTLWTATIIFVIGLLAAYEFPFASANAVGPGPLQQALRSIEAK